MTIIPDNHDQADELRQLVRSQARETHGALIAPKLLAITGGQQGVGSTTIALNVAVALALHGQRTVLVDADLNRGAIAPLCGISERSSIIDVLAGRQTIHEVLTRGPAGVQLVPGVWAPREADSCSASAQNRLMAQLKSLGAYCDAVVIDTGGGRSSFVRRFWQAADLAVVVCTPLPVAIMDCYATIKVLLAGDASIAVRTVVNRSPDAQRASEVQARIAAACRRFLGVRAPAAGHLPEHKSTAPESALGALVLNSPRTEAARAIELLAEHLWLECQSMRADAESGVVAA